MSVLLKLGTACGAIGAIVTMAKQIYSIAKSCLEARQKAKMAKRQAEIARKQYAQLGKFLAHQREIEASKPWDDPAMG